MISPAPPERGERWLRGELRDAYRFPGFTPSRTVLGVQGEPLARVVTLTRRQKKRSAAPAARLSAHGTTARDAGYAIYPAETFASISTSSCAASAAGAVAV
jgi:hypothetical protein